MKPNIMLQVISKNEKCIEAPKIYGDQDMIGMDMFGLVMVVQGVICTGVAELMFNMI